MLTFGQLIAWAIAAVVALCMWSCGSERTVPFGPQLRYAVGARESEKTRCRLVDNAAGALVVLGDHERAADGMQWVWETVKPGIARIDCGGPGNLMTIDVREAVRLELRGARSVAVGDFASSCLVAFDPGGTELFLGPLVEGVTFQASDNLQQADADSSEPPARDVSCTPPHVAIKPGPATVTARWRGHTAETSFEVTAKP